MDSQLNRIYIVPDSLSKQIYARVDEVIAQMPEAAPERDNLYHDLLAIVDEYGYIPEFTVQKKETTNAGTK